MLTKKGAIARKLTEKEKIIQEVIEKIELEIIRAMNGPKGELMGGGTEEFLNGLLTTYRIIEKFDPNPPLKGLERLEYLKKNSE